MKHGILDATCNQPTCACRGTYRLRSSCRNCGWFGTIEVTRGHEKPRNAECPRCACKTIDAGTWANAR